MRWLLSLRAEVAWCSHQALPKMLGPDAIDEHMGETLVLRRGDQSGEAFSGIFRIACQFIDLAADVDTRDLGERPRDGDGFIGVSALRG